MIIHQAIYGVVRNGHGLRTASGDRKTAAELTNRLDLPDTAPPGAEWSPYFSGFPYQNHYVLAKTFHDISASRAGMVLTHALYIPLPAIVSTDDLRPFLRHLIGSADLAPVEALPIEIESKGHVPPPTSDLSHAAAALVIRGSGPVVRIGTEGFDELIAALWGRMWPALRCRFSFRLSFGPGDVVETPVPTIVCTPVSLLGRWQQHRIVGRAGDAKPLAAAVIDGSDAGDGIRRFASSIGAEIASFDELLLLEQAHRMASNDDPGTSRILAAIRLVERLSPNPIQGETEKRLLVERFVGFLPRAKTADILSLRNLSLSGFATVRTIWQALEAWLEKYAFPLSEDPDVILMLREALLDTDVCTEWRRAVTVGLTRSAHSTPGEFPIGFWRWAKVDHEILGPLLELVQPDSTIETRLAEAAPKQLDRRAADPIIRYASKHHLLLLHAVAASAGLPPAEAARLQCKIESGSDLTTIRIALRNATKKEVIDCAAEIGDKRILRLAGEAVAKDPSLLEGRDVTSEVTRAVWEIALDINSAAWRAPEDPRMAFDAILIDLIDGRPVSKGILEHLSRTPLADISSFAKRPEIWRHVNGGVRSRLLEATTDAWFKLADDEKRYAKVELELEQQILNHPSLTGMLQHLADGPIPLGLQVIDTLPRLDEMRFRRWICDVVRRNNPINPQDAELLGKSISARRRREIVNDLVALQRSGRNDLNPALRVCLDLISIWDRWMMNLSPPSAFDKWDSFTQLAADLYPSGPDHEDLWERAGGRSSDLSHIGSGISRWRDAVRSMQRGKSPRIGRLIREMRRDYEANGQLRLLSEDPLFRDH